MKEEKFKNYYTYLSNASKKDFAQLNASLTKYTGHSDGEPTYLYLLTDRHIEDWNEQNTLGLRPSQMDDLLHITDEILTEWRTL
jgi:hypothetical protein